MVWSRLFIIFGVLAGMLMAGQPAQGVKPLSPLEVEFRVGGIPEVGKTIPVWLRVHSMLDAPTVRVQCTFPEGVEIVSGEESWQGELKAGSVKEMSMILGIRKAGTHLVRATATVEYPGGAMIRRDATLLIDLDGDKKNKAEEHQEQPAIREGSDGQDVGEFPLE